MIELKERPKKPTGRKRIEHLEIELCPAAREIIEDGEVIDWEDVPRPTLAEVVEFFRARGIDLNDVKFGDDGIEFFDYGMAYWNPKFEYTIMEPQEEYDARVEQYKQDLKEYQEWYRENKEEIKATKVAIREQKQREKEERKAANRRARLQRERERIQQELEGLE